MNDKAILCCYKCRYFPVRQQWQRYFLNSNTYKCPVCEQLTMFDNDCKTLLDRQMFYTQSQSRINDELGGQNSKSAMKIDEYENDNNNKTVTVIILIEDCEQYFQGFYLNPINSRLKNSFNINKENTLISHSHALFCLNHEFMISNYMNNNLSNNISNGRLKLGLRRVNKIQHLLYCIDEYIELTTKMLLTSESHQKQNIIDVKYELCKVMKDIGIVENDLLSQERQQQSEEGKSLLNSNNKQRGQLQPMMERQNTHNIDFQYKLTKIFEFNHSEYIHMIESSQTTLFKQRINTFYSELYSTYCHNCKTSSLSLSYKSLLSFVNTILGSQNNHLKAVALFSHQPNFYLINQIDQLINQKQLSNNKLLMKSNLPLHHFYLISSKNQQDTKAYSPSKSQSNHNITIEVSHDCLYEQLSSSKRTTYDSISAMLINSFAKTPTQQDSNTGKQNGNSQSQDNYVLLFWTQSNKNSQNYFDNSKNAISFIKIISQSQQIFTLLNQINDKIKAAFIEKASNQKNNNKIKEITLNFKNYTLKILQQTLQKKKHYQIILDRLICYCDGKKVYYVFDFEQKMKENFEQIDFLDQMTLPQELREYALTYENIEIKEQNPFRKANNKVFVVNSSIHDNNFHNIYSDDSDQRESL